jgi:hypothetical protein
MDLGEAVYWLSRYNGYFYANGEIIRFDAVQYTVSGVGDVWITDVEEYQKYFANIPFGGKIYPTGLVRIYSEPFYNSATNTLKEGRVAKHGRGQFGTSVTSHPAGINSHWTNNANRQTIFMDHTKMFNGGDIPVTYQNRSAGILNSATRNKIKYATVNGVIKNHLSSRNIKEAESNKLNATIPGTIQSSALVLDGPTYPAEYNPQSFVQYVHKDMKDNFTHFSTRMRVIGSMENELDRTQTPVGSTPYYTVDGQNIGGSSGGIAIWVDPLTNCGYYYEIVALTDTEVNAFSANAAAINTVFFYKVQADANGVAIPIVLWSGLTPIICDDGRFTGQGRMANEKNPTVYDLGVEFDIKSSTEVTFNLYMNDKMIGSATDKDRLKQKKHVALFARGSSRVKTKMHQLLQESLH